MQNKIIQRRLRALQYPYLNEFDLSAKFVSWLEDTVIRQYEPEDRTFIKSYSDMWESGFKRYLSELGYDLVKCDVLDIEKCLYWLSSLAIEMLYEDNNEEYNKESEYHLPSDSSPEVLEQIHKLADALNIPYFDENPIHTLDSIIQMLQTSVKITKKNDEEVKSEDFDLSTFHLGFTTNDPKLDKAALILRMMYISQQRELQDLSNGILANIQKYTYNPKTNASLGVVGR